MKEAKCEGVCLRGTKRIKEIRESEVQMMQSARKNRNEAWREQFDRYVEKSVTEREK